MGTSRKWAELVAIFLSILLFAACDGGGKDNPPVLVIAPQLTAAPADAVANSGSEITFAVTASGTPPLTYQWKVNGSDIPGATAATYTRGGVTTGDAGSVFTVTVTGPGGTVTSPGAQLSVRKLIAADIVSGYLVAGQLGVEALDPDITASVPLTVTQLDGLPLEFKLGADGILRYLSPGEQFADATSTLQLANDSGTLRFVVPFQWTSRIGSSLNQISEAAEDGSTTEDGSTLALTGIALDGHISDETTMLGYALQGALPIDPEKCLISLATAAGSEDITSSFDINATANTVTLKAAALASLIDTIRSAGTATITFSLSTPEYTKTYGFEHALTYAAGAINVTVVDSTGLASSGAAGTRYVISGFNTGVRVLATVGSDGAFDVDSLPGDSYSVEQVLLDPGTPLLGFAQLPDSSSSATLKLVQDAPEGANAVAAKSSVAGTSPAKAQSPDRAAAARAVRKSSAVSAQALASSAYTVSATAGAEGMLVTSTVEYVAPAGTTTLGLHVEVFTEEFPVFTGSQSVFNDLWQFNVAVPGATSFTQTGKVNQTHATKGTVAYDRCVTLPSSSATSSTSVTGKLGAQNVSDSSLPTSVSLSISIGCKLAVTEFKGVAKSTAGTQLLYPRKFAISESVPDGNVSGQYLSLPVAAKLPTSFGVPATLKFEPKEATIQSVELRSRTSIGEISLGTGYLSQANATTGQLKFNGLLLDPTAQTATSSKVELVAVVKGIVNGEQAESDPFPITVDEKYTTFTPIYLASDLPDYVAENRYGTRDSGGDSWGTLAMLNFLNGTPLRYDDLSAGNLGQTSTGRSVLQHSGHSDGQQVDLRYHDGAGGFSETLGGFNFGAGIKKLADDALAEVQAAATTHPRLDLLVSWIQENRSGINSYCAMGETRRVYIGNSFVATLLIDGKFPANTAIAIPGITKWIDKSSKILPQDDHLNHWHLSTSRR